MNFLKLIIYDDADADPKLIPAKRYLSDNQSGQCDKAHQYHLPYRANSFIGLVIKMEATRQGVLLLLQAYCAITADEYKKSSAIWARMKVR